MDFLLSEEQQMLKQFAREFLDGECAPARVREVIATDEAWSRELWARIVELGWLGLGVPEELGGQGGGLVDLAVLFEEAGRALLPVPLFAAIALGSRPLVRASGPDALRQRALPALVAGELLVTTALFGPDSGYSPDTTSVRAEREDGGYRLTGVTTFVPDAGAANALLVLAQPAGEEAAFFWVEKNHPGLTVEAIPTLDWGRQFVVRLDGVAVPAEAVVRGLDPEAVADEATVLLCAEMVGALERAMDLAVEWGKERVQFGRPIGSFQAVSHRCADMFQALEAGRSLTYAAGLAVEEGRADARAAVSTAKAYLSDAFPKVAEWSLQILAGMGYTWEHDIHLYLRRAKASEVRFGDAPYHRERLLHAIGW